MANRNKIRAADWWPENRRYYIMPDPPERKAPVRRSAPTEPVARMRLDGDGSAANLSRRACLGKAYNGTPHHHEVCTDRRIRESDAKRTKMERFWTRVHKRIDPTL